MSWNKASSPAQNMQIRKNKSFSSIVSGQLEFHEMTFQVMVGWSINYPSQDQLVSEHHPRWYSKLYEPPQQKAISNTCAILWNYFPSHSPCLHMFSEHPRTKWWPLVHECFTQQVMVSLGTSPAQYSVDLLRAGSKLDPQRIILLFQSSGNHHLDTRVKLFG